jgi:hypothetical protein
MHQMPPVSSWGRQAEYARDSVAGTARVLAPPQGAAVTWSCADSSQRRALGPGEPWTPPRCGSTARLVSDDPFLLVLYTLEDAAMAPWPPLSSHRGAPSTRHALGLPGGATTPYLWFLSDEGSVRLRRDALDQVVPTASDVNLNISGVYTPEPGGAALFYGQGDYECRFCTSGFSPTRQRQP